MSCCGGKCGCGSDCQCGNGCGGCKMFPDFAENTTRESLVLGVATTSKANFVESKISFGAKNEGCKCGDNCNCNHCPCK